jgi:hypothetical protein
MGIKDALTPSANFRNTKELPFAFLQRISESLAVLGSVVALLHPALFESGLDALAQLHAHSIPTDHSNILDEVLQSWTSPFTAFSVITNRQTDVHRDFCSPKYSYDLLYTGGFYDEGRLEIRGLGLRCRYEPGTIVALPSGIFPHGASSVSAPRVCIAQYMRSEVLERNPWYRPPVLPTDTTLHDVYYSMYTKRSHYG